MTDCPPDSPSGPVIAAAWLPALLLGMATLVAPAPAAAQLAAAPAPLQIRNLIRAELRPGWITERGTRMAALHLHLADGWKTYWRIPGEAGIAPRFDWSGSQNLAGVQIHWPRPVVFDQGGFRSIGYLGELVLPVELTPQRAGRPIALAVDLNIGICDDICVPVDLSLRGALRGPGEPDALIARALTTVAQPARGAGLSAARCGIEPGARGVELTLRATLPRQGTAEQMVMELPGTGYWLSDGRSWREGGELVGRTRVRAPGGAAVAIDRGEVAFTILSAEAMLVHRGCTGD